MVRLGLFGRTRCAVRALHVGCIVYADARRARMGGAIMDAPILSTRVWVEGLIWSLAAGWLIALVFGTVYNWNYASRAGIVPPP